MSQSIVWSPPGAPALRVRPGAAILVVTTAALVVGRVVFAAPLLGLLGAAVALSAAHTLLAFVGVRSWREAERASTGLVVRGEIDAAARVLDGAWLARAFGPRWRVLARRATVAALQSRWDVAAAHIDAAWHAAPAGARPELAPLAARARYERGDWMGLDLLSRAWLRAHPRSASAALWGAASAALGPIQDAERARALLARAGAPSGAEAAVAARVEAALRASRD